MTQMVMTMNEVAKKDDIIVRKLAIVNSQATINDHVAKYQEGTRKSIFAEIERWLDDRSSNNHVMVITGAPGMGKSVLAAVLCKRIQEACKPLVSHFCEQNKGPNNNPTMMLLSLAQQLSFALPEYKKSHVKILTRNSDKELRNLCLRDLFELLFEEPLSTLEYPDRNVLVVIDGLDESEYKCRSELIDVIVNHFSMLPIWVRFLVTTRPEINITKRLRHLKLEQLKPDDEENIQDISLYCERQLSHLKKSTNPEMTLTKIAEKADGSFLYAYFLVESIKENSSVLIPEQLESSLPIGLSSVYYSYFKRMENQLCNELDITVDQLFNFLNIITAARGPLPLDFISKTSPRVKDAIVAMSTLLPVHDGCVHFFHKSVKHWLTERSFYAHNAFTVDVKEGHRILSKLCAEELEKNGDSFGSAQLSDLMYVYALEHGKQHSIEVKEEMRACTLEDMMVISSENANVKEREETQTTDVNYHISSNYCQSSSAVGSTDSTEKLHISPISHENVVVTPEDLDERLQKGLGYARLGNQCYSRGEFKEAIKYHESHLNVAMELGNRAEEGGACANIGNSYNSLGDYNIALSYHERDLNIATKVGDRVGEGRAFANLGNVYYNLGYFKKSLDYHEHHLNIAKEVGDRAGEGRSYANIGNVYFSLGDAKKAIYYYELDLQIAEEVKDEAGIGAAHGNLGSAFHHLGNFEKAIQYIEVQLNFAKELGDRASEGRAYGNLGIAYNGLGMYEKASEFHKRDLLFAKQVGDKSGEENAYNNLGISYYHLGKFIAAIDCYEKALEIAIALRNRAGEGGACCNLGNAFQSLGDLKTAIHYHEMHLTIGKEAGDVDGQGRAYGNLGNAYHDLGAYQIAIEYHERHLKISEEMGDWYGRVNALFGLGSSFESLGLCHEASEHFQASLEILDDARVHLQSNDEWKINLRSTNEAVYTALWRVLLRQDKIVDALCVAEQGRAQALNDSLCLKYGLKETPWESCFPKETGFQMLNFISSNTVFLSVAENKIFFWVCGKGQTVRFTVNEILPRDSPENTKVSSQSLQALLQQAYKEVGVHVKSKSEVEALEDSKDKKLDQVKDHSSLKSLYDTVISPISHFLQDSELIIVPDGPLCLAPFAAFVDNESKYLCESFTIRLVPSLCTLNQIFNSPGDYHNVTGALLVGDPWVEEVINFEGGKILQLPEARVEVEMIGKLLHVSPLIGKNATKEEVLMRFSSVALVHIAAHGNMATGEIALSPNPTRKSQIPKEEDYLLTMSDILNSHLRAKLVVLSCCHTGQGKIKPEGVVGIARAVLAAGARSVLASLWAIDDKSTLEFMKRFYLHLKEGQRAGKALNRAMNFMRESENFSDVRYWAPFVLIGDDVTLEFQ